MDHRLMLQWAVKNLKALNESETAFLTKNPYTLWGDEDEKTGEARVRVRIDNSVAPIEDIVFRIGDVIHNMRVALDYLAFAVALRNNPRIADDRKLAFQIAFPIIEDSKDWPGKRGIVRQWASRDAVLAFESMQPYKRPDLANYHPLLLLHKLDNPHKHRNLLSAAPAVTEIDYSHVGDPSGRFEFTRLGVEGPFVDGAVVARCRLAKPATKGKAKVQTEVAFRVAFNEEGPAPCAPALPLLGNIAHHIWHDVFPVIEPYL